MDRGAFGERMMRHIRRRQFLVAAGALVALPSGQTQERVRRIGGLFGGSPRTHSRAIDAFLSGLAEHGWVEGRNVTLDLRWAEGKTDRVPLLAADLVRSNPDVILTAANPIIAEVKKATPTIPIVMATGADPVEWGLVRSLSRPGGNLTGLTGFYESTPVKMLELVSALVPRGAQVAALVETNAVFARERYRKQLADTATASDLRIQFTKFLRRTRWVGLWTRSRKTSPLP
jgi:putative tryptophan/tyrosine transport system substrate-binding protein